MGIIQRITSANQFVDEFKSWPQRKNQFTTHALVALYKYYEELSDDMGEDIEIDVVGICCDWSEYKSLESYCEDYGAEFDSIDNLRNETQVIEFDGGILVSAH